MNLNKKEAEDDYSVYTCWSGFVTMFFTFPMTITIIGLFLSEKNFSDVIPLCIILFIFKKLKKYLRRVHQASTLALKCYGPICNGARTYTELAIITEFKEKEIEDILKMCIKKKYLTGITIYSDKRLILLDTDLNDAFSAPTPVKVEHNKSLTLSCDSCGAKTTAETLENNIIIKCEYCGSIINA